MCVPRRVILEHLKEHGLVQGSVDDMVAANLGKIFLPCGLGHFIGLDTHDVGIGGRIRRFLLLGVELCLSEFFLF